ncbi:twin-arginine translocation signal domain-containing protein [Pseudomonas sp. FP603]
MDRRDFLTYSAAGAVAAALRVGAKLGASLVFYDPKTPS